MDYYINGGKWYRVAAFNPLHGERDVERFIKSIKRSYYTKPWFSIGAKTNATSSAITEVEFNRLKQEFPNNVNFK